MNKRTIMATGLLTLAVLGTAGCSAPMLEPERVAAEIPAIGLLNGELSLKRVQVAMTEPTMQQIIVDTEKELRDSAAKYASSFEFERDILVCEQVYVPLNDPGAPNYFEDPTAVALSECINGTIAAYDQMEQDK